MEEENKSDNILQMNLEMKMTNTETLNNSNVITHEEKESFRPSRKRVDSSTKQSKLHHKKSASKKNCQTNLNSRKTGRGNHAKMDKINYSNMEKDSKSCINSPGSLLISRKKDYDLQIDPDVIDMYSNKSIPSPQGTETESVESPESKERRIKIISRQCRLHPSNKKYNLGPVINPPLISPGVMVGYTPAGQRYEVDLNAHRPTWFDSEYSRMQFDDATKINVSRMIHDLSVGQYLPDTLDPDVERRYIKERALVKEDAIRHFENKNISEENFDQKEGTINQTNKMQFHETELRLTEIAAHAVVKINDFPAELSMKMQDILNAELSPLMFLKNPFVVEVVEILTKQSIHKDVAYYAHALYNKIKLLFHFPKSQTFLQYFNSEVKKLDETTKGMNMFDIALMTEEPNKANVATHSTEGSSNPVQDDPEIEKPKEGTSEQHEEDTSEPFSEVNEERPATGTVAVVDEELTPDEEWIPIERGDYWEDVIIHYDSEEDFRIDIYTEEEVLSLRDFEREE